MFKKETRITLLILGICGVIILLISIPLFILANKQNNESFSDYEKIKINEKEIKDYNSDEYKRIKRQLEKDNYFSKEVLIDNYNYRTYTSADIQNMLWNFIFSYNLNNRLISFLNTDKAYFCLRTRDVINAFEELYNINISKDISYLEGYFQYVSKDDISYCFDYGNVAYEYNSNEIYIGIDGIESENGILRANLFVYEFYTLNEASELKNVELLNNAINTNDYKTANNIVINNLNGHVNHKQIEFKINNDGYHFKYQILSSKKLDY